jgi:DNA-binding transcriptional regulator YiaG
MKKTKIDEMHQRVIAMESGTTTPGRVRNVTVNANGSVTVTELNPETFRQKKASDWEAKTEAARIRHVLDMTQADFAKMIGVSAGTLRGWESGRCRPTGAALTLLRVAAKAPALVREVAMAT